MLFRLSIYKNNTYKPMNCTIIHAQNVPSRVHKKFMQPSMLSTSQQVSFLQIDK